MRMFWKKRNIIDGCKEPRWWSMPWNDIDYMEARSLRNIKRFNHFIDNGYKITFPRPEISEGDYEKEIFAVVGVDGILRPAG